MFVLVTNWCSEFRLGTWICLYLDQIGAVNSDMESGYVCTRNKFLFDETFSTITFCELSS